MFLKKRENIVQTRLSYNSAHLRWTKETLTIEYFRILVENLFGLKTFGMTGVTGMNVNVICEPVEVIIRVQ